MSAANGPFRVEWEFPDGSGGAEHFATWEEADACAMKLDPSCRIWVTSESDPDAGYMLEPIEEFFR